MPPPAPSSLSYTRKDAADYRGSVSHTQSGKTCQKWSEQYPNAHERTHARFPTAGLGGHNFCRNPDGESTAWCYIVDDRGHSSGRDRERKPQRWEACEIGAPQEHCPDSPPPPPPRHAPKPPSPPPPKPCPKKCKALAADGNCDADCNIQRCLWDMGDCKPLIEIMAEKAHIDPELVANLHVATGKMQEQRAIMVGAGVGVVGTVVVLCALCAYRRHMRRRAARNSAKGLYMPYGGDGDVPIDPDNLDPERIADAQDQSI